MGRVPHLRHIIGVCVVVCVIIVSVVVDVVFVDAVCVVAIVVVVVVVVSSFGFVFVSCFFVFSWLLL